MYKTKGKRAAKDHFSLCLVVYLAVKTCIDFHMTFPLSILLQNKLWNQLLHQLPQQEITGSHYLSAQ